MSRMINDLTAVRMMVGMGALTFTNTPLVYIYALTFMFTRNGASPCIAGALRDCSSRSAG